MSASNDRAQVAGILAVVAFAFVLGAIATAGTIEAQCDRYGRAVVLLTAYTCEREQPR